MYFYIKEADMIHKLKEPGSAITHFIGMLMAIIAAVPLIIKATANPDRIHIISLIIFISAMILLYTASTVYHSFNISERVNRILKKIDHAMIFILIAGTYTPICLIVLKGRTGYIMCALVWGIAIFGIIIKSFWIYCPKWFSSIIYIAMGWICILVFNQLIHSLSAGAFTWLLIGGIIYTVGGIVYALKIPLFNRKHKNFGTHEIFHILTMAGSICHFILMYFFIAIMPV
jgi:hemolysin III